MLASTMDPCDRTRWFSARQCPQTSGSLFSELQMCLCLPGAVSHDGAVAAVCCRTATGHIGTTEHSGPASLDGASPIATWLTSTPSPLPWRAPRNRTLPADRRIRAAAEPRSTHEDRQEEGRAVLGRAGQRDRTDGWRPIRRRCSGCRRDRTSRVCPDRRETSRSRS